MTLISIGTGVKVIMFAQYHNFQSLRVDELYAFKNRIRNKEQNFVFLIPYSRVLEAQIQNLKYYVQVCK